MQVSDNVCYDHLGHGFFLEDSIERDNTLDGNLGISTKFGYMLMSDMDPKWCKECYDTPKGEPEFDRACGLVEPFSFLDISLWKWYVNVYWHLHQIWLHAHVRHGPQVVQGVLRHTCWRT